MQLILSEALLKLHSYTCTPASILLAIQDPLDIMACFESIEITGKAVGGSFNALLRFIIQMTNFC